MDSIPADEYDDDPMATPRDGLAPNTRGEYEGPSTPFKWWLTTGGDTEDATQHTDGDGEGDGEAEGR